MPFLVIAVYALLGFLLGTFINGIGQFLSREKTFNRRFFLVEAFCWTVFLPVIFYFKIFDRLSALIDSFF